MSREVIAYARDRDGIVVETRRETFRVPLAADLSLEDDRNAVEGPGRLFKAKLPASPAAPGPRSVSPDALIDLAAHEHTADARALDAMRRAQRVLVRIRPPDGAAERTWAHEIAWERLRAPSGAWRSQDPIALNADGWIARQVDGAPRRRPRMRPLRLRVLVVVLDATDPTVRFVADGLKQTARAIRPRITVEFLGDDTAHPLSPQLLADKLEKARRRYHVIHFVGHGVESAEHGEAAVCFGDGERLAASRLTALLAGVKLRLAAFNVCWASRAEAAVDFGRTSILEGVADFVLAPARPEHCVYAREFNDGLYRALAREAPIPDAVTQGRRRIQSVGGPASAAVIFAATGHERLGAGPGGDGDAPEWDVPILYTVHGVGDAPLARGALLPMRAAIAVLLILSLAALVFISLDRLNDRMVLRPAIHHVVDGRVCYHAPAGVSPFCLDLAEVSVRDYRVCVTAGGCSDPLPGCDAACANKLHYNYRRVGREDHPMNLIAAADAQRFCSWRGGRLASLKEYRFAAGGANGLGILPFWRARRYCWGNSPAPACEGEHAIHMRGSRGGGGCDGAEEETAPVADPRYAGGRTPEGVWNLCGNVWEMIGDHDPEDDLRQITAGGGLWEREPESFRVDYSESDPIGQPYADVGFRCAYDLHGPAH